MFFEQNALTTSHCSGRNNHADSAKRQTMLSQWFVALQIFHPLNNQSIQFIYVTKSQLMKILCQNTFVSGVQGPECNAITNYAQNNKKAE